MIIRNQLTRRSKEYNRTPYRAHSQASLDGAVMYNREARPRILLSGIGVVSLIVDNDGTFAASV
jgi:hypothetical protein